MPPNVKASKILVGVALPAAVIALVAWLRPAPRVPAIVPSARSGAACIGLECESGAALQTAVASDDGGSTSASAANQPKSAPASYNVVLITIDTLRHDLVGHPRSIMPNLDALAARSTVFERAYAMASYTPKSLGPLIIGRYASETHRDGEHFTTFYPANVFVAERASAAGVRTFGAMTHHYFKWNTGMSEGFESWDVSALPPFLKDNDATITSARLSDVVVDLLSRRENVTPSHPPDAGAADSGIVSPRRFFAWFHYVDPHAQYVAHAGAPAFETMADGGEPPSRFAYEKDVWFTDLHVGRVLDTIAAADWGAETAIIVTSDHGEAFGEKEHWKHGREVWEPLIRVPLIVHVPGAEPRTVALKRSHIDIAPTIVELLGLPAPEEGALRGTSLVRDMRASDDEVEERDVYVDMPEGPYNEARRALVFGPSPGFKLIDFGGRYELYDLDGDPGETKNLVFDRVRLQEGLGRLRALRGRLVEQPPNPPHRPLAPSDAAD